MATSPSAQSSVESPSKFARKTQLAKAANGEAKEKPARDPRPAPPDRSEVLRLIAKLNEDLTGAPEERVKETLRKSRLLAPTALDRLGLIVSGLQGATPPQVVYASIAILKAAGLVGKSDGSGPEIAE